MDNFSEACLTDLEIEVKNYKVSNISLLREICKRESIELLDLLINTNLYDNWSLSVCINFYWNINFDSKKIAMMKVHDYFDSDDIIE